MYLKKDYLLWSIVCYHCFVDTLGLTLRLVKVADKRRWPKNGAPPLAIANLFFKRVSHLPYDGHLF